MAIRKKHWSEEPAKDEPTRKRSDKHEKSIQKRFGGRQTSNSGARFGENDLKSALFDIEAKTTANDGYRITASELKQIRNKSSAGRIPAQIIRFEKDGSEYIILSTTDFLDLIGLEFET